MKTAQPSAAQYNTTRASHRGRTPGEVDAPTKKRFSIVASLLAGRRATNCLIECERPKAAPLKVNTTDQRRKLIG